MYKEKKKGVWGIVLTIFILILIVIFSNSDGENSFLENAGSKIIMPIQNGFTFLANKLSGNEAFFADVDRLKEENEKLSSRNKELEKTLKEMESIKTENETLKEYLGLTEKYKNYKTIPGDVINKDISNYSRTITINIGAKDGVKKDMTVIAEEGLVGHVIAVTDTTAKVQTIIDPASSVSTMLSTTKEAIVSKGTLENKQTLKAVYIPTEASVIQGDGIQTSGLGGVYPKGINVGTIKKVVDTENLTDRYALVEVAVDFNKLNSVLVINQ
ncbi:MAG: rod shape-determining protein MreC [Clostridia bacterium]|nr:rod shape-determining protein MreC [Clostridia bacterium]